MKRPYVALSGFDMNDESLQLDIKKYLDEAKMMQLATANNNAPWICNVWFAADKDLAMYWISSSTRRHSQELNDNPLIAAAVCVVQHPDESNRGGLQIEGRASEVTNPLEIAKALKLYVARGIFTLDQIKKFMSDVTKPHKFYRITPSRIVFFDPSAKESVREYIA